VREARNAAKGQAKASGRTARVAASRARAKAATAPAASEPTVDEPATTENSNESAEEN
jgi:hypothetical protein